MGLNPVSLVSLKEEGIRTQMDIEGRPGEDMGRGWLSIIHGKRLRRNHHYLYTDVRIIAPRNGRK